MNLTNRSNMTSGNLARILSLAAMSVVIGAGSALAQDAEQPAVSAPVVENVTVDAQTYDNSGRPQQPDINFQQNNNGGGRRGRQQQFDAQGNPIQGQNQQGQQGGGGRGRGGRGGQQQMDQLGGPGGGGPGGGGRGRNQQYNLNGYVAPEGADQFTQEFGMISLHNIFMLRRGIPPVVSVNRLADLTPEQMTTLTGLIKDDTDGEFRAIVDDARQNRVVHLKVNDTILTGKITAIHIGTDANDIVYQPDGKEAVTIQLGSNFLGQAGGVRNARLGAASAITPDFTGYNGGTNNTAAQNFGRGGFGGQGGAGGFAGGGAVGGGFVQGGGAGGGGRGQRGGGGGGFNQAPTIVVPAAPLPGTATMSLEERMRLRRATEGMAGAVAPITEAPAAAAAPAPAAAPVAAPIVAPNVAAGAGLSMEEQMRLRRLQQVGQ